MAGIWRVAVGAFGGVDRLESERSQPRRSFFSILSGRQGTDNRSFASWRSPLKNARKCRGRNRAEREAMQRNFAFADSMGRYKGASNSRRCVFDTLAFRVGNRVAHPTLPIFLCCVPTWGRDNSTELAGVVFRNFSEVPKDSLSSKRQCREILCLSFCLP